MTNPNRYRAARRISPQLGAWLCCLTLLSACSGGSDDDPDAQGTGGTGSIDVTPRGGTGSGSSAGSNGGSKCGNTLLDTCAAVAFEPEGIPLDIYVMFDQSGSMLSDVGGLTRLAAVQQAVATFLRDPQSATTGVGIGYFGFLPIGQVSCDPAMYGTPDVPLTLDHEAVISSLSKRMPTGETPTAAALRGACGYAEGHRAAHPDHAAVILLVTDGKPEAPVSCASGGCCPSLEDATKEAAACLSGQQQVPTYVLGVGPNLENLHAIAQAGGTKNAYIVGDQNVAANVLSALTSIRRDAQIPCDIEVPTAAAGTAVDYGKVNVLYSQPSCASTPIYYVESVGKCAADGGWYYDNPSAPSRIRMCPTTCQLLNSTNVGLQISVGCESLPPPIR